MNLQNIFNQIEENDPEFYERMDDRRQIMHRFKNLGGKLALTAIPVALGSMFSKAYGQTGGNAMIVDVLNFALTLEYLEAEFYATAVGTAGLITPAATAPNADETASFGIIKNHEAEHVTFLSTTITSLGGTPTPKPDFDFTAGGAFPDVFSNFHTFIAVSQTFEDTGVRAYKGQAGNLISNNDVLTAALQIHSVEARHASHIRRIRRIIGDDPNNKPWITGNSTGTIGSAVQASYNGEDVTTQLGVDITTLPNAAGTTGFSAGTASEAFDEPLTKDAVLAIVMPFIK